MKISVLQENLAKGLTIVNRSISARAQLPILTNILLSVEKGRLKLSATDLETGINLYAGAKIEKEGAITIPAKVLVEFVSSLPAGKVNLETKGDILKLSSGNFQAEVNGLNAAEFPKIPSFKGRPSLTFKTEEFRSAINQVAFAAATDEARPVLTGVRFSAENKKLILAATDGYRLSVKKLEVRGQKLEVRELIIPAKTLQEVARTAEGEEIKFLLMKKGNQLIFGLEDIEIVCRLIEGEFPPFEKIIPQEEKTNLVVDREEMVKAVKVAAIFAREAANIIKFKIQNSKFKISANAPQVGSNISEVEAKIEGEENKIAFNSRYLLDFLSSITAKEIVFQMTGPLNPGVFRVKGDDSLLHIIMPVRVQE